MNSWARLSALVGLAILAAGGTGCAPVILGGVAATTAVKAAEDRGLGGAIADVEIQARINHLWLQHSLELYRSVSMTIDHGRVLLTGRAATPEIRLDAVRLAWQADGVKEVINEIQVDNASSLTDSARDTWITTQLRGKLLLDREVVSINYSIDTVNAVVYLMGVARSQAELERVTSHARALPYVQRVVSYVNVRT